ncbi:MAG: glycoside hydrolase family 3 C-terminal domain-containing protein, partial [Sphingorhabdus sp.]|nr:glycoside hydrolase family 3 C-terminal domain-containing protein [Sphingorhabdus sp.]
NPTKRGDTRLVGAPDHLALAREAVAKSLVLLKNNDATLPVKPGARVLIAGPGADNMAMQAGGWTISWQGGDTRAEDFTNGQTIGRAVADAVRSGGGQAEISPSGDFGVKPDVAIVVMGERPYAEFEGDVPHLAFQPTSGEEDMIARLKAKGVRVAVVFLSGRPMFTGKLINQADAFVAAWLPGTQGRGIADVLVAGADGKPPRDFTGRLSFAWPSDARSPVAAPLFPIGYGQSYSQSAPLGPVNEDARVDLSAGGQANFYMRRGNVPAPWRLAVDGSVTSRVTDISAQEDARQFTWNAKGILAIEGAPVDLTAQAGADFALLIDWRIDTPVAGPLLLSFGGVSVDISAPVSSSPTGTAVQTRVPLSCFAGTTANLANVGSPFRLEAGSGFVATLRNIQIEAADQNIQSVACPGQLP